MELSNATKRSQEDAFIPALYVQPTNHSIRKGRLLDGLFILSVPTFRLCPAVHLTSPGSCLFTAALDKRFEPLQVTLDPSIYEAEQAAHILKKAFRLVLESQCYPCRAAAVVRRRREREIADELLSSGDCSIMSASHSTVFPPMFARQKRCVSPSCLTFSTPSMN